MNPVTFQKRSGIPLYQQLYSFIKQQILEGNFIYQERLLSIRKCAKLYQISQTSVLKAYDQLLAEGLIQTKAKSGYYVCMNESQRLLSKTMHRQQLETTDEHILLDLRSHSIDGNSFDKKVWNKCIKDALESKACDQYGDAQGERALRIALQKHAYQWRNVLCDMEQMIIGASVQSLLYILAGLLPKHYVIAMEEDAFPQGQFVFQQYGLKVMILKRLEHGIDMDSLYQNQVDLLYVNVNSCGRLYQELSNEEKQELLEWAKITKSFIIEDDHNGELNYRHESRSSMQGHMNDHVCYIGSFSRILLPSIRISYMILPDYFYQIYQVHQNEYGPTSSKIEQIALSEYIVQGHMNRHIQKLKKLYHQKSILLETYLNQYFGEASIQLKESSLAYVVILPYQIDVSLFLAEVHKQKIAIEINTSSFTIGFASIQNETMEQVIAYLANLCQEYKLI